MVPSPATRRLSVKRGCVAALLAALAVLLAPTCASAAEPLLEYVVPNNQLPVAFTVESGALTAQMASFEPLVHCEAVHGEGEITGPRSTVSTYTLTGCTADGGTAKCKTENANPEEIQTGPIEATLVYIDQAKHEVGELLNPNGGTYLAFECGKETAEARGSFLSTIGPINTQASIFTATLSQSGSVQEPDEYENLLGEKRLAIPQGQRGTHGWVTTGVEAMFTVEASVPLTIKAITSEEIEAKLAKVRAELKREEEAITVAVAKRRLEEEVIVATVKKREEEEAAVVALERKRDALERELHPTRAELLAKALRVCEKEHGRQRVQCKVSAHRKYDGKAKKASRKRDLPSRSRTARRVR